MALRTSACPVIGRDNDGYFGILHALNADGLLSPGWSPATILLCGPRLFRDTPREALDRRQST